MAGRTASVSNVLTVFIFALADALQSRRPALSRLHLAYLPFITAHPRLDISSNGPPSLISGFVSEQAAHTPVHRLADRQTITRLVYTGSGLNPQYKESHTCLSTHTASVTPSPFLLLINLKAHLCFWCLY